MAFELTHARHDHAHCLAPGLFRSLKRGTRKDLKLDVTYQYGPDEKFRFVGFEPLGVDDMRVLQGLVALGGPTGVVLTPEPTCAMAKQLRSFLNPQFDAKDQDGLVVQQNISKLLSEIGLTDSGDNIKNVKASLFRMANVTVGITKGSRQATCHLLSYGYDEKDGRLFVALNPRISEAVLGCRSFVRIEMQEVRGLKTDPARLIHQRLCGWIDCGKSGKVELDTLCCYAWNDNTLNVNTLKTRRQSVKKSLDELVVVGWTVCQYAKGKYEINRPRVVKERLASPS